MLDVHIPTEIGWFYNTQGVFSFITEFWNPLRAAGITLEGSMSLWLGGLHPVEDELRLLRWNDEELGGKGFVPWHAFDHPQLGPVEIGGWDKIHYWYNAPFDRLERGGGTPRRLARLPRAFIAAARDPLVLRGADGRE